jgi:tRNA pseudouridine55 synthase
MDGLILIDKPKAISSFGVVYRVRKIASQAIGQKIKAGHSGTLDPAASGLLILAIGAYTKRLTELIKQDKTYQVTMCLGKTSSTGDSEGEIVDTDKWQPTKLAVKYALAQCQGYSQQTPPQLSAIKINGQRAYRLAREGVIVAMKPRPITIKRITLLTYSYPYVIFLADVSSGTYIRSLVLDIASHLGTGAYMSDLRRLKIGRFDVSSALPLGELTLANLQDHLIKLEK